MATDPTRTRRKVATVVAGLSVALAATACGTRESDARITAAAGLSQVSSTQQQGSGTTTDTTGGVVSGTTGDTGAAQPSAAAGGAPVVTAPVTGGTTGGGTTGTTGTTGSTGTTGTTGTTGSSTTGSTTKGSTATKAPGKATASTAPASTAAAGGGAANGSPVTVAVLGTFSGAVGAFVSDTVKGVQVWASYTNAHGGVNGHPVNVVVGDDGGDPAKYNSLQQQFVTQNHAIAFIYTTIGFAPNGNNSYLDGQKILTFGTEGGLDTPYQDPWVLTDMPSGHSYADAIIYAASKVAVPAGHTKLASLACSDFSLCDNFDAEWNNSDVLKATGFTNVYRARPSLTQPDFTAQCLSAKQAGADVMLLAVDTASDGRLADDCARQNYHPQYVIPDLLALPSLLSNPNLDGAIVATKIASFADPGIPGIATYLQAFKQYAPSSSSQSGSAAAGWATAAFFGAAAANLPANPTPADVLAGLRKIKGNNLNGLTYPLDYTGSQQTTKKLCFGVAQVKNKAYVPISGASLVCP